jgi:predicted metal-dependent phosphoesterase TrpH
MRIDLHAHSDASDGTTPPAELVVEAVRAGLDVVALTDHDTTAGWDRAAAALPAGLTLVPGAELSCAAVGPDGTRTPVHLLAYLFDRDEPELAAERKRLRESRLNRARHIVDNLAADGLPVDWERVKQLAAGAAVGRPHIARALVEAGRTPSVNAAFGTLLADDSPYYVPKADIEVIKAIRLVRQAGGVPVFAHPLARRRGAVVDDDAIAAMAAAGLAGLEVDHVDHDDRDRAHLRALAADLRLVTTGSSDYHGANKTVRLGDELTPVESYDAIVAQATGATPRAADPLG